MLYFCSSLCTAAEVEAGEELMQRSADAIRQASFMGMRRLQGSVARAVSAFNEGATEMLGIMNKLYVDISYITLELLTKKDQLRIRQADAVNSRVGVCRTMSLDCPRRRKERW
ncbi:hypothetical protein ACOMHN_007127 [Nucella lapillus]